MLVGRCWTCRDDRVSPGLAASAGHLPCTQGQHGSDTRGLQGHSYQLALALRTTGRLSCGTAAPVARPPPELSPSLCPRPEKLRRRLPERQRKGRYGIPPFCRANSRTQGRALLT